MSLIEVIDLKKTYGSKNVLEDVNFAVESGDVLALIGRSGAGKTTLLRLLDMLEKPSSGRILFDGVEVSHSRQYRLEVRRRMAFVLQKPVVFNTTVYENVACGMRWRGEGGGFFRRRMDDLLKRKAGNDTICERVDDLLEMVELSDLKGRNARTLSGGEAQRVALARAMILNPEVLLMDEPTANLDPVSTTKVEEVISRIIDRFHTTVIMATHDMAQGQRLASRIGMLIDGKIVQEGTPREIFYTPGCKAIAEFVGVENVLDGTVISNTDGIVSIAIGGHLVEAVSDFGPGEGVYACIRPEDVTLLAEKVPSSARNCFPGKVIRLMPVGPLVRVEIDCGFPVHALVTRNSAQDLGIESQRQVLVSFKATAVHVILR